MPEDAKPDVDEAVEKTRDLKREFKARLSKAKAVHKQANGVYKAACKKRKEIETMVRSACDAASKAANDVAALQAAVDELEKVPDDAGEASALPEKIK
jgi:heterodisulfide reductase subunit A-like polyferredoxin